MAKKTDKICIVCGKIFQGTAKAKVCTPKSNCRVQLKRLLAKGIKPPYELLAKSVNKKSETKQNSTSEKEMKNDDKKDQVENNYPISFGELLSMAKNGVYDTNSFKQWVYKSKLLPNQKSMVLSQIKPSK